MKKHRTKPTAARGVAARILPRSTGISPTERRHPASMKLDEMAVPEIIELMLREDAALPGKILRHRSAIARLVRMAVRAWKSGGRLFYVGAGTSGRLGVLDASECPPTFSTNPEMAQGIIAGGRRALTRSIEGAEDDYEGGAEEIARRQIGEADFVLGIAASGSTPFVWGALKQARTSGAATALLCFNPKLKTARGCKPDVVAAMNLGPEILTGSTRLKCGTATKLVLNMITTIGMVQLGKVVSNLMVDVRPSNAKLRERAVRILRELTGADDGLVRKALARSKWNVKAAREALLNGKLV